MKKQTLMQSNIECKKKYTSIFSTTIRTLLLFTCLILGSAIIDFVKTTSESMPVYTFNIVILCMLGFLWYHFIKIIKIN